jgi:phenylpropionate dioxygenase-like ring-hydroxylating dioxygenase large terminal subunit
MNDAVSELFTEDWWVHGSIYSSPGIFRQEQERIFRRCWLYVGHESELPEPGDYKTTFAGTQPVIVARGSDDGRIRVLLNRCRHRGASVCHDEAGTANFFRCPYHGWTYYNSGALRGVPYDDAYPRLDRNRLGLTVLPRTETYAGFIFTTFAEDGPSLTEYLGNAAPYLDLAAQAGPEGIRLSAGSHKIGYDGNWKLQMENTQDGYHFAFVHRSYLAVLSDRAGTPPPVVPNLMTNWRTADLGGGHSLGEDTTASEVTTRGLIGGLPFNVVVFPTLAIIGAQVRHVLPKAVDRTEVRLYPMMLNGADDAANARILRDHEEFNGPAGEGTTDDMEIAFFRTADGKAATAEDWVVMSRGVDSEKPGDNGIVFGHALDELPHRAFYRQWRRLMEETP